MGRLAAASRPPVPAAVPAPAMACLFSVPPCGLLWRMALFEAWRNAFGPARSLIRAHAWTLAATAPSEATTRCQPTLLRVDVRRGPWRPNAAKPPCGCWVVDALLYRGPAPTSAVSGKARPGRSRTAPSKTRWTTPTQAGASFLRSHGYLAVAP